MAWYLLKHRNFTFYQDNMKTKLYILVYNNPMYLPFVIETKAGTLFE